MLNAFSFNAFILRNVFASSISQHVGFKWPSNEHFQWKLGCKIAVWNKACVVSDPKFVITFLCISFPFPHPTFRFINYIFHFNLRWHQAMYSFINILLCMLINQYWAGLKYAVPYCTNLVAGMGSLSCTFPRKVPKKSDVASRSQTMKTLTTVVPSVSPSLIRSFVLSKLSRLRSL